MNKKYQISFEKQGGTLDKGIYNYSYKVTNSDKKLNKILVEFSNDYYEEMNHMPRAEKVIYTMNLICDKI